VVITFLLIHLLVEFLVDPRHLVRREALIPMLFASRSIFLVEPPFMNLLDPGSGLFGIKAGRVSLEKCQGSHGKAR